MIWRHSGKGRSDVEFVVARSLRDTAALLGALRAHWPEVRSEFSAALAAEPPSLRVGLCVRSPAGTPVDPDCRVAAERAAQRLSENGHAVSEAWPDTLAEYQDRALHGALFGTAEYRACLVELEARLGRPVGPGDVEPFLWELSRMDEMPPSPEALHSSWSWNVDWIARTLRWFARFDLLVTPTVCEPAPLLETLDPTRLAPLEMLERMVPHMAFTEPWNATGQPAITLPTALSADGLPLGVQLVAAPGREALLLSVAATLVDAAPQPWLPRPRVHA